MAFRAGVKFSENEVEIIVPFLNEEYRVRFPSGEVYHECKEVPLDYQILILHYLSSAEGVPLKHQWISFKELPSGQIYINPFYNRAVRPLVKFFGQKPEALIKAGMALGGKEMDMVTPQSRYLCSQWLMLRISSGREMMSFQHQVMFFLMPRQITFLQKITLSWAV